jgi:hypothetical protein
MGFQVDSPSVTKLGALVSRAGGDEDDRGDRDIMVRAGDRYRGHTGW